MDKDGTVLQCFYTMMKVMTKSEDESESDVWRKGEICIFILCTGNYK